MNRVEPHSLLTRYVSFMTGKREAWTGIGPIDNFAAFLTFVPATGIGFFRGMLELVHSISRTNNRTNTTKP